jgi:hypothetical protein
MTDEERNAKRIAVEEGVLALLPAALKGKTETRVVVLKSGMTKVYTKRILKPEASGEQGGLESPP